MQLLLGERVRELRLECGLTQSELGKRLGYSKQGLSKIEKNINKFTDYTLIDELAYELNCTRDYLIGLSDEKDKLRNGLTPLISRDPNWEAKESLNQAYLKNKELGKIFIECVNKLNKAEQTTLVDFLKLMLQNR